MIEEFKNKFGNVVDFTITREDRKINFTSKFTYYGAMPDSSYFEKDCCEIVRLVLEYSVNHWGNLTALSDIRKKIDEIVYGVNYAQMRISVVALKNGEKEFLVETGKKKFITWCDEILDKETKRLIHPFVAKIEEDFCDKFFCGYSMNLEK